MLSLTFFESAKLSARFLPGRASCSFCEKLGLYFFHIFWKLGQIMLERDYQSKLIAKLKDILPGCVILKNDTDYLQGIPDLLILYGGRWAMLEVKRCASASHQPNQDYYVDMLGRMSYAAFIFPENEEEILREVQRALDPSGAARLS